MRKKALMLLIVSSFLICLYQNNELNENDYSFADTLIEAYHLSGKDCEIEQQLDNQAIIRNNTNGKRILIDNELERIISYDYSGDLYSQSCKTRKKDLNKHRENNSYKYNEEGNLIEMIANGKVISFDYDGNKITKRNFDGICLQEKKYDKNNKLIDEIYSNGYKKFYKYCDNNLECIYDDNPLFEFKYNGNDLLEETKDYQTDRFIKYSYTADSVFDEISYSDGFSVKYFYDESGNNIARVSKLDNEVTKSIISEYGVTTDGYSSVSENDIGNRLLLKKDYFNKNLSIYNSYDYISKQIEIDDTISEEEINELVENNLIEYDNKIQSLSNKYYSFNYEYEGDLISNYRYGNEDISYEYDEDGQLIEYYENGNAIKISYDHNGNILGKNNSVYCYNEDGLLNSYNGEEIIYDSNFNPVVYRNNLTEWKGTKLTAFNDTKYTYDKNGRRTTKYNGVDKTSYYYDDGQLIFEKNGSKINKYNYLNNELIGITYQGHDYFYLKNKDKDIVAIIDENGQIVVEYIYDPFGKVMLITGVLKDTLGKDNPYRYRSYRYDNESSLYYLQTRYYDPETGRFINADDIYNLSATILGGNITKNLFAYCNNSPVNYEDSDGRMARFLLKTLKSLYSDLRLIPDFAIGGAVLPLNGLNFWNAFHETAQLVACKELALEGYLTDVEYPIKSGNNSYEADILAYRGVNYLYEVKTYYNSVSYAQQQLLKYCSASGFIPGSYFYSREIKFFGSFYMNVFFSGNGIIRYQFTKKWSTKVFWKNVEVKKEITEENMEKALSVATWAGLITASAIILATIAEDFITCGAGVADDAASVVLAAESYSASVGALAFLLV